MVIAMLFKNHLEVELYFFGYFAQIQRPDIYKRTEIIIRIIAYFYQEIFTKQSLSQYYWTFFLFISEKLV